MFFWRNKRKPQLASPEVVEERVRRRYEIFRELLALNNEALELIAGLQEDLQYVPPLREVLGDRVKRLFEAVEATIGALERLTGAVYVPLREAVANQRLEVERYLASWQESRPVRMAAWLSELSADSIEEAGSKAALLAEVKNRLGLPVPDGFVLTTEAYWRFCGVPLWMRIRDAVREINLEDLEGLHVIASALASAVMAAPVPRAVEVAISERARTMKSHGLGLAVRSSAVGEGGERTFAGQFLSLLNVPPEQAVEAYKRVIAGRFSEPALCYRITTGLLEVESPMAVLFLPMLPVRAAGILYTRDPKDARSDTLWIAATRGVAAEIASGRQPADLFVLSRRRPHRVLERSLVEKPDMLVAEAGGGLVHRPLEAELRSGPSLGDNELVTLAEWGVRIEQHFRKPQDVEWALDEAGKLWILQARPLAVSEASGRAAKVKAEPLVRGGRTVYAGLASGPAFMVEELPQLRATPPGAIVFLRKASPEITQVLPRIAGLVAEWGNLTGHAATLLREFRVPSVFGMPGVFERIRAGEPVSLDAAQRAVYAGLLWPSTRRQFEETRRRERTDPLARRVLTLNLVDPATSNFRPSGCQSAHDVLRFAHEKAIEVMFTVSDAVAEYSPDSARTLVTPVPVNILVVDLGGGLALDDPECRAVSPEQIVSRPWQALWRGISHPGVSWTRDMPAGLSDLASVIARSLTPQEAGMRGLGEKSYLLVAAEYMNLNSRLAYHFSLVDACLCDNPAHNYISFRFAGGGATRYRRNLRACFIQACLEHYGFSVDRRGDLVNAWFKKATAEATEHRLDILGRLMACSGQLDMYMTSEQVMRWYVQQFLEGNYAFVVHREQGSGVSGSR